MNNEKFMNQAISFAKANIKRAGGPFGAVVVKDGEIVARAGNGVTRLCDPTAHAEVQAIRKAAKKLGTFDLSGCEIYTTCEPCPMCLSAIYWAHIDKIYYACTSADAAGVGFDDKFIYEEIDKTPTERKIPTEQISHEKAREIFAIWAQKEDKTPY